MRLEIIRTLGVIRDPTAGPTLEKLMRDRDPEIVEESIVGRPGRLQTARPLLEELFRTSGERQVRAVRSNRSH